MKWAWILLGFFLAGSSLGQHHFKDAERWSKVFDDPARDEWQRPGQVVQALKLATDAAVADLGAGTGYFATRLARAVPQGKVYAADLEPDMVNFLNERAARGKLPNLAAHLAEEHDPKLPAKVDLVLVVDTYHHIGKRERYFDSMKKYLKPGGRVAIIDFKPDSPVGPPRRHRIAAERVMAEMGKAGYRLAEEPAFLPYQYFLVFTPAS
jgi:SAM-dependent methyltransferase